MKRLWSTLFSDDNSDDESSLVLFKDAEEGPLTAAGKSSSAEGSKSPSTSLYSESLQSPAESHEGDEGLSSHDSHGSSGVDSVSQSTDSDSNSESDSPPPSSPSPSNSEPDPTSPTVTTATKLVSSTSFSAVHPTLAADQQTTRITSLPIVTPPVESGPHSYPPHGVALYSARTSSTSISTSIYSYYQQRYTLFSRFDEGIWMTQNSWFEVTPEKVGAKIAERVFTPDVGGSRTPKVVLDVFCGVGGNSIQFALSPHCERVFAIDNDPAAVWCARKNAELYGVLDKITFIVGDFFEFSRKYYDSRADGTEVGQTKLDIVFCSPPWGGPTYRSHQVFDVEMMKPHAFGKVWEATMKILRAQHNSDTEAEGNRVAALAVFYLPRTSNLNQLAKYVGELGDEARADAVHYCCYLRSKAVCLYVGGVGDVASTNNPSSDRSKNSGGIHSGGIHSGDRNGEDEGAPEASQETSGVCGNAYNPVEDTAKVDRTQDDNQSTHIAKKRKRGKRRKTNGVAR